MKENDERLWNVRNLKQVYGNVGLQVKKCRVDSGFWWNMYILVHACICKRGWLLHHNHSYDTTQYQTHVGTSLPVLLGCYQSLDGLITHFRIYVYITYPTFIFMWC